MAKILLSDATDKICAEQFKARGHDVDSKPGLSKEELKQIIGQYDGEFVRLDQESVVPGVGGDEIYELGENVRHTFRTLKISVRTWLCCSNACSNLSHIVIAIGDNGLRVTFTIE